jgi:hypothetical protein
VRNRCVTAVAYPTSGIKSRVSEVGGGWGLVSSDQVVVGDIPQEPPGFQARRELLAELDRADVGAPVVSAVTGASGAGKTQLAAAYARAKLAAGWPLVAWINAEDTGSLLAGLAAVADAAGRQGGGPGPAGAEASQAVRQWLEMYGNRCLLVFEDVANPDALPPFVPVGGARILLTSTQQAAASLGSSIPVDVFSPEEAQTFLSARTGLADEAGAAAVAAELDHLPLALAQAAAVIAAEQVPYGLFLERLRTRLAEQHLTGNQEKPYPRGAAAAVLMALEAIQADDQAGLCAGVMELIAVLSPTGVRRELLHAAGQAGVLAGGGQPVTATAADQALARLAERSLLVLSMDGQTVMAHRLVTRVIRAELVRQDRLATVCLAVASVLEARAEELAGSKDRSAVRDIPQQVAAIVARLAEPSGELAPVLLRLRFWALYHLVELCDSAAQAIAVGEPLIADLARIQGPYHPDTLNARNSLAAAYRAGGRSAEAIGLFEGILVARQRLLGPNHRDTLISQNNLAAAYQAVGRGAEAVLLFKLTLAVRERMLGVDHPSTVNSRANLAAAYQAAGRSADAIPLLEEILAARERALGAGHPDTEKSRANLTAARQAADRPGEAITPAGPPPPDDPPPETGATPFAAENAVPAVPPAAPEAAPEQPQPVKQEHQEQHQQKGQPAGPGPRSIARVLRRRIRLPSVAVTILALLAAGVLSVVLSDRHTGGHPSSRAQSPASGPAATGLDARAVSPPAQLAAEWVSQQVSRSAIVACDPAMCSLLRAQGVPAANLLILRLATASPLGAAVIVVTPAVRSQFGDRLDSVYAPSVIAGFGSGPGLVSVQVIAKDGPAAYLAALRQDLAARKAAGDELLANKRIVATAQARTQLVAGEVDSRLLIMLPALAAVHPIQILAFGGVGPEAEPGVPLCWADLSGSGRAAGLGDASYLGWLTAFLRAQPPPFAGNTVLLNQDDQPVVRVEFTQPSPLGLLAHR